MSRGGHWPPQSMSVSRTQPLAQLLGAITLRPYASVRRARGRRGRARRRRRARARSPCGPAAATPCRARDRRRAGGIRSPSRVERRSELIAAVAPDEAPVDELRRNAAAQEVALDPLGAPPLDAPLVLGVPLGEAHVVEQPSRRELRDRVLDRLGARPACAPATSASPRPCGRARTAPCRRAGPRGRLPGPALQSGGLLLQSSLGLGARGRVVGHRERRHRPAPGPPPRPRRSSTRSPSPCRGSRAGSPWRCCAPGRAAPPRRRRTSPTSDDVVLDPEVDQAALGGDALRRTRCRTRPGGTAPRPCS